MWILQKFNRNGKTLNSGILGEKLKNFWMNFKKQINPKIGTALLRKYKTGSKKGTKAGGWKDLPSLKN